MGRLSQRRSPISPSAGGGPTRRAHALLCSFDGVGAALRCDTARRGRSSASPSSPVAADATYRFVTRPSGHPRSAGALPPRGFSLVATFVDDPAFFVLADSPFRTLADLVAHAKAKPEEVTYGTSGIGSDDHLAALAFERLAGVKLTHVPFAGASAVRNALLGRQITVASLNMGEGVPDMQSGAARALGQMAERRWEVAPDTPTFREQGFDIVEGSMRGVAAPAGVPREVLDRLVAAVRQAMENPEFPAARRAAGAAAALPRPGCLPHRAVRPAHAPPQLCGATPGASATSPSIRGRIRCGTLRIPPPCRAGQCRVRRGETAEPAAARGGPGLARRTEDMVNSWRCG